MNDFIRPDLKQQEILYRVGLISDTHMPLRWPSLPASIFNIFAGVDLLLHAGDVGELWVLDELSRIAPVVAVHGNDETAEAARELPLQQIITIAGKRLLLWHSHFPDPVEEMASRTPEITPARNLERGRRAEADIVVFGHWHIPHTYAGNGILTINPGAIASGNVISRQDIQTVALLYFLGDGRVHVVHYDLANPAQPFYPQVDWEAGFAANAARYSSSILAPALTAVFPRLYQDPLLPAEQEPLLALLHRLAHRCWAGKQEVITSVDLLTALEQDPALSSELVGRVQTLLGDQAPG